MHTLLLQANALEIPLPDESVHCVVTSPPYWALRDYGLPPLVWDGEAGCAHVWGEGMTAGEGYASGSRRRWQHGARREQEPDNFVAETAQGQFCRCCGAWRGCLGLEPTPELYVAHLVQIFREVRRVLRADGTLWLNLGDSYAASPKGSLAGQDKSTLTSVRTQLQSPAKGVDKLIGSGLKPKDMVGMPWRIAFALQADGWWLRSDIIWHKPNCMPESVTDRPTKAHEYLFLLARSERYFYDAEAIKEPVSEISLRRAGYALHCDRPSAKSRGIHVERMGTRFVPSSGRNWRTIFTVPTQPYSGAHFATFPPALAEPCIKAGTSERGVCPRCGAPWERVSERETGAPPSHNGSRFDVGKSLLAREALSPVGNGERTVACHTTGWRPTCACEAGDPATATVLDPFVGSGTTLLAARALGRRGVGLDLSFDYLRDQARERLELRALDEWQNGKKVEAAWHDLPLFVHAD